MLVAGVRLVLRFWRKASFIVLVLASLPLGSFILSFPAFLNFLLLLSLSCSLCVSFLCFSSPGILLRCWFGSSNLLLKRQHTFFGWSSERKPKRSLFFIVFCSSSVFFSSFVLCLLCSIFYSVFRFLSLCSGFLCCFWVYASVCFFMSCPCVCSLWFSHWFFVLFFCFFSRPLFSLSLSFSLRVPPPFMAFLWFL